MRGCSFSYILPSNEVVSSSNAVVAVVTSTASMAKQLKHSIPSRNAGYYSWNGIKHKKMTSAPCDWGGGSSRPTLQNFGSRKEGKNDIPFTSRVLYTKFPNNWTADPDKLSVQTLP